MKLETQLLRQIHPSFIKDGAPTSQAFHPTPKDKQRLSVDNGDKVDAATAYARFTGSSCGVQAVNAAECETLELPVIEDSEPYPEHCSIDFAGLGTAAMRNKARLLRAYAAARGWLYPQLMMLDHSN